MPTTPSDLDILMSHVHEINAKTDAATITEQDTAVLIAYHRNQRHRRAAGFKTAKIEKPTLNVNEMLGIKATPFTPVTGTVRRS